jgi:hypothetical protein
MRRKPFNRLSFLIIAFAVLMIMNDHGQSQVTHNPSEFLVNATPVPEPSRSLLALMGVIPLLMRCRRSAVITSPSR